MNFIAFWRLAWKEYRAIRAFWIAIVALIVVLQLLALGFAENPASAAVSMYSLALGAPAFFALGCAGAAFAMEREEGTYDFLRASPVSARQVLASKLSVAFLATAALLAALWLLAGALSRQSLPQSVPLAGMLGLWLVAAVEAIAWGTLFSLLSARPLVAICLALVATTTTTHLLAWSVWPPGETAWKLEPYAAAVPRRLLVAAFLLAVDVILGLRWLDGKERPTRKIKGKKKGDKSNYRWIIGLIPFYPATAADDLIVKPDRSAVVGHLLWQHFRQSGRLMLLMGSLSIAVSLLVFVTAVDDARDWVLAALAVMTALSGACVFLADQEKRHYRFFVEHNVPPRTVWLTRQVPWMATVALATLIVMYFQVDISALVRVAVRSASNTQYFDVPRGYLILPSLLGLNCAVVAYAAGQWASMTLRSGLIAGFVGVTLAGALCFWVFFIGFMNESWLVFVAPIPLVLLWATWLKAPDWTCENTSLRARVRAAAAILAPAVALVATLAVQRVTSVAPIDPGFDVNAYLAEITPEARQTAALYRRASDLYLAPVSWLDDEYSRTAFLADNAEALALVLEASRQPSCVLDDPRTAADDAPLRHSTELIRLVIESGRQLQDEGKLDEALDRYFAVVAIASQLTDHRAWLLNSEQPFWNVADALRQLPVWAAAKGQTVERIKGAIDRLRALDAGAMHLQDGLKSNYVLVREFLSGQRAARETLNQCGVPTSGQSMWLTGMPWERFRESRLLNHLTNSGLRALGMRSDRLNRGDAMAGEVRDDSSSLTRNPVALCDNWLLFTAKDSSDQEQNQHVYFEELKRTTLLILALEAYRLDQGQLPEKLEELVGTYFDALPLDPYSARPFVYYPHGIPEANTPLEKVQREAYISDREIAAGQPGFWSTGQYLVTTDWRTQGWDPVVEADGEKPDAPVYYRALDALNRGALPTYVALHRGHWYTIPNKDE